MGKSSRGCLKNGCFGCLGITGLVVLILASLAALQLSARGGAPEPITVEQTHRLSPDGDDDNADGNATDRLLEDVGTLNDGEALGEVLPLPRSRTAPTPRPGRLELDLSFGEFEIRRGEPGEPLKVEADYDAKSFEFQETFSEQPDGSWNYAVSLGNKGGFLGMFVIGEKNSDNRITITVPPDHPIDIVGEIGFGETDAYLGGLWIQDIELELGVGDHILNFDTPTREPMRHLRIQSSIGEVCLESLGNASPQDVLFQHSIGAGHLDLRGAWLNDATVEADFSIGEMQLELPDTANVIMAERSMSIGEISNRSVESPELPEGAPEITLRVAGSIGEISLE